MKNKKTLVIVAIILIILMLAGGVCGYLYFGTDIFKSDKERFFKYIAQNGEISKLLEDDLVKEYAEKKTKTPYENSGEIKVSANTGESSIDDVVKNIGVEFNGKVDNTNKKVQQDVNINYSSEKASVRYVQDGDKFAIKSDLIGEDYLGIENNNLKEFAKKLGITDTSKIPDKIDVNNLQKEFFTKEELKQIYDRYYDILVNGFEDNDFSRVTENNQNIYKLTITDTRLLAVCTKMLETLKDDTMILEKVVKYSDEKYTVEELQRKIEDGLEELKDTSTENKDVMYITVYEEKGKLVKTEIQIPKIEDSSANIIITKSEENAKIEITIVENEETTSGILEINKVKENADLKYNIEFSIKSGETNVKVFVKADYINIKRMNEVNENVVIGIEGSEDTTDLNMDLTIKNKVNFVNKVETDSLSDAKLLNDYSEEELQSLFAGMMKGVETISPSSSLLDTTIEDDMLDSFNIDEEDSDEEENELEDESLDLEDDNILNDDEEDENMDSEDNL